MYHGSSDDSLQTRYYSQQESEYSEPPPHSGSHSYSDDHSDDPDDHSDHSDSDHPSDSPGQEEDDPG